MTDETENPILAGLNSRQAEAVNVLGGPLLIIAGAGSGKTKVLTHRVANLIRSGVKPWKILALTFTNKAAKEMRERIGKIVSEETAKQIVAGTFHSVFAMILRREADKIGYTSDYTIIDTSDAKTQIKNIMKDFSVDPKEVPPQAVLSKISNAKNQMMSPSEMEAQSHSRADDIVASLYTEYQRRLLANNSMDFDDLLLNMVKLFRNAEMLEKYQNRYDHVLVDEYQDTNRVQYLLINLLAKAKRNLCVVGDDAQSIYRWRGADIRNILDFQKDYRDAKTVRLEQNYRSTKNIIGAADCVIKKNTSQLPKTLWTDNEDGDLIGLNQYESERDEANSIARKIDSIIRHGEFSVNDFAILYRTNAQSLAFETAFNSRHIHYKIFGTLSFFARAEVKNVLAYLRLLVNPRDDISLQRIVNEPPRGIGATSMKRITEYAKTNNISLFDAFKSAEMIPDLQKRAIVAIDNFTNMILSYTQVANMTNPVDDVREYIEKTQLLDFYKEMNTDEAKDKIRNIGQLVSNLREECIKDPEMTLGTYLQNVSLTTDADTKDMDAECVKLMTLHSAKGLEFPYVFMPGVEQNLFPLVRPGETTEDELEEERRLFYVGITRAERKLELSYCMQRFKFGETTPAIPSQFLKEIDKKYLDMGEISEGARSTRSHAFVKKKYDEYSQIPQETYSDFDDIQPEPRHFIPKNTRKVAAPSNTRRNMPLFLTLKVGDIVSHKLFGLGKVESISGLAENKQVKVAFKTVGVKNLLIKFANLEIVKNL